MHPPAVSKEFQHKISSNLKMKPKFYQLTLYIFNAQCATKIILTIDYHLMQYFAVIIILSRHQLELELETRITSRVLSLYMDSSSIVWIYYIILVDLSYCILLDAGAKCNVVMYLRILIIYNINVECLLLNKQSWKTL